MRATAVFILVLAMSSTAFAGPQSTIGGKPLKSDTVHNAGVGAPSLFYEWWNNGRGKLDWALGAELVYANWSGAFSDMAIGLALNAPLRWHIHHKGHAKATTDVGFRFTPGVMVGSGRCRGRRAGFCFDNRFDPFDRRRRATGGIRAELAIPISIDVHERVSVVTGGTIPLTFMFARDVNPWGIIPLMVRLGVEINASPKVAPFFLLELGPAIGIFGNGFSDVDFAFRVWFGTAFWSVLGK